MFMQKYRSELQGSTTPHWSEWLLLKNLKRYMHPNVHAALFTIAKAWKPPKRPWTEEWIEEMWCIYIQWNVTQPLRKNETMPFAATGMGLEIFILSEVSQIQKEKYHMVSLIYGI